MYFLYEKNNHLDIIQVCSLGIFLNKISIDHSYYSIRKSSYIDADAESNLNVGKGEQVRNVQKFLPSVWFNYIVGKGWNEH